MNESKATTVSSSSSTLVEGTWSTSSNNNSSPHHRWGGTEIILREILQHQKSIISHRRDLVPLKNDFLVTRRHISNVFHPGNALVDKTIVRGLTSGESSEFLPAGVVHVNSIIQAVCQRGGRVLEESMGRWFLVHDLGRLQSIIMSRVICLRMALLSKSLNGAETYSVYLEPPGAGAEHTNHTGNVLFERLMEEKQQAFKDVKQRSSIVKQITEAIVSRDGQFLEKVGDDWEKVSSKQRLHKLVTGRLSHCARDMATSGGKQDASQGARRRLVSDPSLYDVLFEVANEEQETKTTFFEEHPGNIFLDTLVDDTMAAFLTTNNKNDVVMQVIHSVLSRGARFLEKRADRGGALWGSVEDPSRLVGMVRCLFGELQNSHDDGTYDEERDFKRSVLLDGSNLDTSHPGNARLRQLIIEQLPSFTTTDNKADVVFHVIESIRARGGQFLEKSSGRWQPVPQDRLRHAVHHRFLTAARQGKNSLAPAAASNSEKDVVIPPPQPELQPNEDRPPIEGQESGASMVSDHEDELLDEIRLLLPARDAGGPVHLATPASEHCKPEAARSSGPGTGVTGREADGDAGLSRNRQDDHEYGNSAVEREIVGGGVNAEKPSPVADRHVETDALWDETNGRGYNKLYGKPEARAAVARYGSAKGADELSGVESSPSDLPKGCTGTRDAAVLSLVKSNNSIESTQQEKCPEMLRRTKSFPGGRRLWWEGASDDGEIEILSIQSKDEAMQEALSSTNGEEDRRQQGSSPPADSSGPAITTTGAEVARTVQDNYLPLTQHVTSNDCVGSQRPSSGISFADAEAVVSRSTYHGDFLEEAEAVSSYDGDSDMLREQKVKADIADNERIGALRSSSRIDVEGALRDAALLVAGKRKRKFDFIWEREQEGPSDVRQWLQNALPSDCDEVPQYVEKLVEDGFSTLEMIEKFLKKEDLDFMPKAYQRAAWLSKPCNGGGTINDRNAALEKWIRQALPNLDEDDCDRYVNSLIEDGFDSADMLESIDADDLSFMKRAHKKRVVLCHHL